MCLAVPMRLVEMTTEGNGLVQIGGMRYEVNLSLVEDARIEDYLIVHAGFAIERLEESEARLRLDLFEKMAEIHRRKTGRDTQRVEPPSRKKR